MKILSWNVNGIRAVVRKGELKKLLKQEKPDVLCVQEIKIGEEKISGESFDLSGYQEFWNSAQRPGYAGTLVLIKNGIKVIGREKFPQDEEGRVIILELKDSYLVNVYFHNANGGGELKRLGHKIEFNNELLGFLKDLEKKKPLIVAGDYNVAHNEIDIARPGPNEGNAGFTIEERAWMSKFLKSGFKDTFRELHPEKVQYSWWSFRGNARDRNVGWRLDYLCVSSGISKKVKKAYILDEQMGSDHAPVGIELE